MLPGIALLWLLPVAFVAAGVALHAHTPSADPALSAADAERYRAAVTGTLRPFARLFLAGGALNAVVLGIIAVAG